MGVITNKITTTACFGIQGQVYIYILNHLIDSIDWGIDAKTGVYSSFVKYILMTATDVKYCRRPDIVWSINQSLVHVNKYVHMLKCLNYKKEIFEQQITSNY